MVTIKGYDYLIDEDGNIKSLLTGKMLKLTVFKNGYKCVSLRRNMKTEKHYVHRLVAQTFIPNPESKRTVNHIDGDTLNNNVSNLEWATDGENNKHSYDYLGREGAWVGTANTGKHHACVKIQQFTPKMEFVAEYDSMVQAASANNISRQAIGLAINGKTKLSGGYIWKKKEL